MPFPTATQVPVLVLRSLSRTLLLDCDLLGLPVNRFQYCVSLLPLASHIGFPRLCWRHRLLLQRTSLASGSLGSPVWGRSPTAFLLSYLGLTSVFQYWQPLSRRPGSIFTVHFARYRKCTVHGWIKTVLCYIYINGIMIGFIMFATVVSSSNELPHENGLPLGFQRRPPEWYCATSFMKEVIAPKVITH